MVVEVQSKHFNESLSDRELFHEYISGLAYGYTFSVDPVIEGYDGKFEHHFFPTFPLAPLLPSVMLHAFAPEFLVGDLKKGFQTLVNNVVGGALWVLHHLLLIFHEDNPGRE